MEVVRRRGSVRRLAALALLDATLGVVAPHAALAALNADRDALAGLVVDEADLVDDGAGRLALGALPGVRARQPLDAVLQIRLEELIDERDAIGAGAASGADAFPLAPLPGEDAAPPRVDSGAPDPDRLHTAPPAPAAR